MGPGAEIPKGTLSQLGMWDLKTNKKITFKKGLFNAIIYFSLSLGYFEKVTGPLIW